MLCKHVFSYLFAVCISVVVGTDQSGQACSVKLPKGDHKAEIYTNNLKWKEPTTNPAADGVTFECKTGFVSEELTGTTQKLECKGGVYNGKYGISDLLCRSDFHEKVKVKKIPASQLNSGIFQCNAQGWAVYEVSRQEKPLYKVCLDTNTMRPKFSYRLPQKEPVKLQHQPRNDVWGFDGYGKNAEERMRLSQGYVQKVQRRRTTSSFPERFSNNKQYPYYYNRGHLTAFTDFGDKEDQKTTVEYINAAPQWEDLNKHSWSIVEQEVRRIIQNTPEKWEIYTGTYGSIPTSRGPLFLSPIFDDKGHFIKGQLPVPLVFWKLAYNIERKELSRVFIGVNNPEIKKAEDIGPLYKLCATPIANNKKSVQGDEYKGFTYECPVPEFLTKLHAVEKIRK